jgi:hypothetical protein
MNAPIPEEYRMAFTACSVMGQPFDRQLMVLYRLADAEGRDKLMDQFRHVFDFWRAYAREHIDVLDDDDPADNNETTAKEMA